MFWSAQELPQLPQCKTLLSRTAQDPLQSVVPAGQEATHPPLWHFCPAEQSLPQPPQLSGSMLASTQLCPQVVSPGLQVGWQEPRAHTCELVQA